MTRREFPGALVLGLLASFVAHAALFGGDHAMGGAYHGLLLELAIAGSAGFAVVLGSLAVTGSRHAADGSVLGSRLSARLPGLTSLCAATGLWFTLGEMLEPQHAGGGLLPAVVCVIAAAWALRTLARGAIRLLAEAAITVARTRFAVRTPVWARIAVPAPLARRSPLLRRRFARPPPIASARA